MEKIHGCVEINDRLSWLHLPNDSTDRFRIIFLDLKISQKLTNKNRKNCIYIFLFATDRWITGLETSNAYIYEYIFANFRTTTSEKIGTFKPLLNRSQFESATGFTCTVIILNYKQRNYVLNVFGKARFFGVI